MSDPNLSDIDFKMKWFGSELPLKASSDVTITRGPIMDQKVFEKYHEISWTLLVQSVTTNLDRNCKFVRFESGPKLESGSRS